MTGFKCTFFSSSNRTRTYAVFMHPTMSHSDALPKSAANDRASSCKRHPNMWEVAPLSSSGRHTFLFAIANRFSSPWDMMYTELLQLGMVITVSPEVPLTNLSNWMSSVFANVRQQYQATPAAITNGTTLVSRAVIDNLVRRPGRNRRGRTGASAGARDNRL